MVSLVERALAVPYFGAGAGFLQGSIILCHQLIKEHKERYETGVLKAFCGDAPFELALQQEQGRVLWEK
jgi:hypothetical protein